jgi:hypothetical protein
VIRRMGPQVADQGIAVSSDRALARDLAHLGVEVIGSSEFRARLRAALQHRVQEGTDDQQDVLPSTPHSQPKSAGRCASRAEGGTSVGCAISRKDFILTTLLKPPPHKIYIENEAGRTLNGVLSYGLVIRSFVGGE